MNDFIQRLSDKREEAKRKSEETEKDIESKVFVAATNNRVIAAIDQNTEKQLSHKPTVKIKNDNLAKSQDIERLVRELKETQLATLLAGQQKSPVLLADSTDLGEKVDELKELLSKYVNTLDSLKPVDNSRAIVEAIEQINLQEDHSDVVNAIDGLEMALKGLDITPKVTVPQPKVEVSAPDLSPIQKSIEKLDKSIKSIKIEEKDTDLTPIVDALDAVRTEVTKVYEKPQAVPEYPTYATNSSNQLIVDTDQYGKATDAYAISNIEDTGTYKYFGFEDADGAWYIMRKTISTSTFEYVKGASNYSTAWTNRASQSYGSYGSTF